MPAGSSALEISVSRLLGENEQTDFVRNERVLSEHLKLVDHPEAQRLLRAHAALDGKQQRASVSFVETMRAQPR